MQNVIQQIHDANGQFEIAVAGGGTSAISKLLEISGASRSLLNGVIPYSDSALTSYLGTRPASACSDTTARLMATRAFHNARKLCSTHVIGIGATAALQTDRIRRGADQLFVAVQSRHATRVYHLSLDKQTDRISQERQCAEFIILIIAASLDIDIPDLPSPSQEQLGTSEWQALLCGDKLATSDQQFKGVFPGAFNPPHQGHVRMKEIAEQHLGATVAFEISAFNVDKPPLDYIDLAERQSHLDGKSLVFTHAATFLEKSALFPGAAFVVGIDTLTRIDDPKYYGHSEQAKEAAIKTFADGGHHFLVFGRLSHDNFLSLTDVEISPALRKLCTSVPESEFREDISSSAIRSDYL